MNKQLSSIDCTKQLFSIGYNLKLAKDIPVFNLPEVKTCPFRTEFCEKYCYAKKATRLYQHTKEKREYNFQASLKPDFVFRIITEIQKFNSSKIRLHESGDFYSIDYFQKWIEIINKFKNITFLAYTRNILLAEFKIPENFKLYFSVDPTTPEYFKDKIKGRPVAEIILKKDLVKGGVICYPKKFKTHNYCGSKCLYCWETGKDIKFLLH